MNIYPRSLYVANELKLKTEVKLSKGQLSDCITECNELRSLLESQGATLKDELGEKSREFEQVVEQLQTLSSELELVKSERSELVARCAAAEEGRGQFEARVYFLEGELVVAQTRVNRKEEQCVQLKESIDALEVTKKDLQSGMEEKEKLVSHTREELSILREDFAASQHARNQMEATIKQTMRAQEDAMRAKEDAMRAKEDAMRAKEDAVHEVCELRAHLGASADALHACEQEASRLRVEREALKGELAQTIAASIQTSDQVGAFRAQSEQASATISELHEEFAQLDRIRNRMLSCSSSLSFSFLSFS